MYSLIHGSKIILVDDKLTNSMTLFIDYMEKHNVIMINTTPTTRLKLFMENETFKKFTCTYEIYNGYGSIECYFFTYKKIHRDCEKQIIMGKPIYNYKIYILDKYMKPILRSLSFSAVKPLPFQKNNQ
ncbi:hypothetical protein PIROE2DRAFT_1240 [Piromyces sp. E2]|nr:hypothetical protein PIROE2DRAFT_1240 [Piromyces sp. E2]|eukprot:OUM70689.1 hypothetical protein PIROE2DRAFT_1240 [Piromyces sp. E2]